MLRRFGQIALGVAYGVYLAYFAPEPQRQAAAERTRQRQQPQMPTQVEQEQVRQPSQVQVAPVVPVLVEVLETSVPTSQALEVADQPDIDLTQLKIYKLRGESVVRIEDLPFHVPIGIERYKLRHRDVIKLSELERLTA